MNIIIGNSNKIVIKLFLTVPNNDFPNYFTDINDKM